MNLTFLSKLIRAKFEFKLFFKPALLPDKLFPLFPRTVPTDQVIGIFCNINWKNIKHSKSLSIIHPVEFAAGLFAFVTLFGGALFLTNKNPQIQRIKRDKPFLSLVVILVVAGFIFNLFGSLLMFLFSICMPILCKFVFTWLIRPIL